MTMTSLKITKAEREKEKNKYKDSPCAVGMDDYGYGLRLRLGDRELEKLGLTDLPKVGKKMRIAAVVTVIETRSSERSGGEPDRSVELQVQKLDLDGDPADSAEEAVSDALDKD